MSLDNIVKNQTNTIRARNNRKNIGIDIDNTLFYIPVVEYINAKYGESYNHFEMNDWSYMHLPEHIRQDVFQQFKSPEFMCSLKSIYGTYQTIRDWHSVGHKIFLITKRAENLRRDTYSQIEREFPGLVETVAFVGDDSKVSALRYFRIDTFIDDFCVRDGLTLKLDTWLITNENTAYNHSLRTNDKLNQAASLRHVRLLNDHRAIIH